MKLTTIILMLFAFSCGSQTESEPPNKPKGESLAATERVETKFNIDKGNLIDSSLRIKVSYVTRGGPGAQWVESKAMNGSGENLSYFYVECAEPCSIKADTLFDGTHLPVLLELTGKFYEKVGYPSEYQVSKGNPEAARVFRYTKIKILSK
jgi:hypothetical protein